MVTRSKQALLDANLIRTDGGTQSRAEIDMTVVADYASEMRAGSVFPPLVVFFDGSDHWLSDGFHRYLASRDIPLPMIACDVRKGTLRDAILYAVGANKAHGLKRSNADKRNAVVMLLKDEEWTKRSDRWIAEQCGVSNHLVAEIRSGTGNSPSSKCDEQTTGRDGKKRSSGKRKPNQPEEEVDEPEPTEPEPWQPPGELESGNGRSRRLPSGRLWSGTANCGS